MASPPAPAIGIGVRVWELRIENGAISQPDTRCQGQGFVWFYRSWVFWERSC